ncbi:mechanosensitive ion channel family protein [Thermodesulfobacteriota bacterium]
MRLTKKMIIGSVVLAALLLISSQAPAEDQPQVDQTAGLKGELPSPAPDLAEIIPLATKLTGRLAALENRVAGLLDMDAVGRKYSEIEENLKGPADQLKGLKNSKIYNYNKLVELREIIEQENEMFEKNSEPLSRSIRQLGAWRKEWLAEKKGWHEWQSSLREEGELVQLKLTFAKANDTIDKALNLLLPQLEAMLAVQEKGGHILAKIDAIDAELDRMILSVRHSVRLDKSPPMISSRYYSQFSSELWLAVQKGLNEISWPGNRFFAQQGWVVLLQGFISLFVIIAVYRKREALKGSKRWRFLAARPLSAGFYFGMMTTVLIYEYAGAPATWKVIAGTIVGGISFARLSGGLTDVSWKRQFVYGLMILLIVTRLMDVVGLPLPLFRIYILLTALAGLLFCLRWARETRRHKDSGLYAVSLRLISLLFAVIIITEFWGKEGLALYLFDSLIRSIAITLVFMLFLYLIRGGLEWLFRASPLRRAAVLYKDTDAIIHRVGRFFDVVIWGLVLLPAISMVWGVYDSLEEASRGLLALGFNLGSQRISVGLLLVSAGILYGSFLASWIFEKLLMDEVLVRSRLERGVRLSMARLVHYAVIFLGFLIALSTLGFEVTKITIVLSALGVGIGFGLQGIVNNFVSGLILLFERPVRVGDTVEIGGKWAEIKKIGLRATTVQTLDQADVIIPNADLVSNQVTNWTLSNRRVRLTIPVGVAYGSDVPLVMETLMACANANATVTKIPAPQVLFLSFGESSLDFELRIWILDADNRLKAKSELHQEIDHSFREANIEIAFPQRDLHVRSVDESVTLQPQETTK